MFLIDGQITKKSVICLHFNYTFLTLCSSGISLCFYVVVGDFSDFYSYYTFPATPQDFWEHFAPHAYVRVIRRMIKRSVLCSTVLGYVNFYLMKFMIISDKFDSDPSLHTYLSAPIRGFLFVCKKKNGAYQNISPSRTIREYPQS